MNSLLKKCLTEKKEFKKLLFCSSIFIGLLFIPYTLDNDIWFLLNSGRYILIHGIPHMEPFTIHQDFHFVMQQWLSAVIFWKVYASFGPYGLIILLHIVDIFITYILFRLCMLVSSRNWQIATIITTVIGVIFISLFIRTRPQIFSGLLLLIEIFFLEKYSLTQQKKYLLILPFLSVLLINLHAALWPMLFVLMLPFIADALLGKLRRLKQHFPHSTMHFPLSPLLICLCVSFAVGFCNPYGWESMSYLSRSYGYSEINLLVSEMHPVVITSLLGKLLFPMLLYITIVYARKIPPLRYILLTGGTACMALSANRSVFLLFLLGVFPLAYVFKNYKLLTFDTPYITPAYKASYRLRCGLITLLLFTMSFIFYKQWTILLSKLFALPMAADIILLTAGLLFSIEFFRFLKKSHRQLSFELITRQIAYFILLLVFTIFIIHENDHYQNPDFVSETEPAVNCLLQDASTDDIRLWTNYNTGNYAEYKGIRCYLDTRADVFLPRNNWQTDILHEYFQLETSHIYYKDFINHYHFTHFLTYHDDALYTDLYNDPAYKLIYSDKNYRLYKSVTP